MPWRAGEAAAPASGGFTARVAAPVAVAMALVLGLAALGILAATRSGDEAAITRQERVARHHVAAAAASLAHELETVAVWDDAVERTTHGRVDADWLDESIGTWLHRLFGHDRVYVLDRDDQPVYAMEDGGRVPPARYEAVRADLAGLVATARDPAVTAPGPGARKSTGLAVHATEFGQVAGRPAAASVMRVVPHTDGGPPAPRPGALLVSVRFLDGSFLEDLREEHLLEGARFSGRPDAGPGERLLPLDDPRGRRIGYLAWTPEAPGTAMLWHLLAYVLPMAGVAAAAMWLLLRRLRASLGALAGAREAAEAAQVAAEQADRAKSRFLAAASHDLRQPVQGMALFAGVLEGHVADGPGREALAHLNRGLDALKGMLDGLLDISRLEAGSVATDMRPLDLRDLLRELTGAYGPVAEARGVRLTASPPPLSVLSDRVLLGRMLRNLLENAVRYTPPGGSVRLECSTAGGMARVTVADTGIGIPEEHQGRVFDEFHQVGNPGRNREEGLGLGLAIVRRLSVLLGHPVEVWSRPGEGSRFTVLVPLARAPAKPAMALPVPAPGPADPGRGRLALVVEDDAIVLLGLRQMLESLGYAVLMAADPDQAVERVRREGRAPDLVVTDYRLRDGRVGTEAVARVRSELGCALPGLLLTGEAGPEVAADAEAHGLRLVHKPVTPRQLAQALRSLGAAGLPA